MFAIAGVSGHVGAATADALLKQGQKVRVLVRKPEQGERWEKRHAEVLVVDLADEAALTKALTGMSGAFLLLPPNPGAKDFLAESAAFIDRLVRAVKASGLKNLAYLSSVGAQHPSGTGPIVAHHRAEKALKGVAPSVTFVRPAYFLENWSASLMSALETGELRFFGQTHHKFPQVCAKDIGEAAAKALIAAPHGTKIVEVTGKEPWSVEDVAQVVHTLLDAPVRAVSLPVEQAKDGLVAAGLPEGMAALYAELYQGLARGLVAFSHPAEVQHGATPLFEALKTLV
jgi:uncharacterized protein YbjT (DUF2867 family)